MQALNVTDTAPVKSDTLPQKTVSNTLRRAMLKQPANCACFQKVGMCPCHLQVLLHSVQELKVELKSRNRQVAVALCDSLYALTRLSSLCIDVEAGYVHNSITYTDQVLLCPALR